MTNPFSPLAAPDKLWGMSGVPYEVIEASPRRMVVDLLRLFVASRTPVTLWGPVGARKTRTIEALAREVDGNGINYQVITIQPSTQDPTVIHGMMYTSRAEDGSTIMKRSVPDVAQQIVDYHNDCGGYTILFADEMTTCMPSQQNAMLGLLTHGKYGDVDTSPYTTFVMAANPVGTVSTVNDLSEAVMNRGGHLAWYGDPQLFLEEWSDGFGSPTLRPSEDVEWFVKNLILEAPDHAFRNPNNWSPESLVPWSLIEHTERAVTELGKMVGLVNRTFASADDRIRYLYIIEVTRAICGNEWAARAAAVTGKEGERLSYRSIVEQVRAAGVTSSTTTEEMQSRIGSSLYTLPSGSVIRQDQAEALMASLVSHLTLSDGSLSQDTYLASWAFITSAETSGQMMGMHGQMMDLMKVGQKALKAGALEREAVIPAFVPNTVRVTIRSILTRQREQSGAQQVGAA